MELHENEFVYSEEIKEHAPDRALDVMRKDFEKSIRRARRCDERVAQLEGSRASTKSACSRNRRAKKLHINDLMRNMSVHSVK